MAKKPLSLAELEVNLREEFQTYRRRLDMVTRARSIGLTGEALKQFVSYLAGGDETSARKLIKIAEVTRGK